MSRRLRTVAVQQLLAVLYAAQRDQLPRSLLKFVDGKPLPVGGCSKDPDAKFGHAAGSIARGYKLVCIVDEHGAIDDWRLGPMNLCEHHQAVDLLKTIPQTCLMADAEYDKNHLYEAAARYGIHLIAQTKRRAKALGHRRHSPHRLKAKRLLASKTGQYLMATRTAIERSFGNVTSFAGGLGPLPAWVRRPHRVALWVAAKFIIDATRRIKLRQRENA
ncbi:MAG: transposase [Anaerolineaceae bacterium]|nr:transposase [Anaerolineaceae bacterium]